MYFENTAGCSYQEVKINKKRLRTEKKAKIVGRYSKSSDTFIDGGRIIGMG